MRVPGKIIDRYVGLDFLRSFALALAALTFMILIFIEVMPILRIESKEPPVHIMLYLLYRLPRTISLVMPAALMFGVCFSVAQFNMTRELIAMQAAGVSFYRATATLFIAGAVAVVVLFLFQNLLVTVANKAAAREMSIIDKDSAMLDDVVFQTNLRGKEGYYFIYFFDREKQRIVGGFNYLTVDDKGYPKRMLQARVLEYRAATEDWKLIDGREVAINPDMDQMEVESFDERIQSFPEDVAFFSNPRRDPEELNIIELWEEMRRREGQGVTEIPYKVQFHVNISFPLMCIIVVVVGAIAGGTGGLRSMHPLIPALLVSIVTYLGYGLIFDIGRSLGKNGFLPPVLAGWGPTLLFMTLAGYLVYRVRR